MALQCASSYQVKLHAAMHMLNVLGGGTDLHWPGILVSGRSQLSDVQGWLLCPKDEKDQNNEGIRATMVLHTLHRHDDSIYNIISKYNIYILYLEIILYIESSCLCSVCSTMVALMPSLFWSFSSFGHNNQPCTSESWERPLTRIPGQCRSVPPPSTFSMCIAAWSLTWYDEAHWSAIRRNDTKHTLLVYA